jgi:molybdenum-dependent DNA-binding transcriptional regulator ModE
MQKLSTIMTACARKGGALRGFHRVEVTADRVLENYHQIKIDIKPLIQKEVALLQAEKNPTAANPCCGRQGTITIIRFIKSSG